MTRRTRRRQVGLIPNAQCSIDRHAAGMLRQSAGFCPSTASPRLPAHPPSRPSARAARLNGASVRGTWRWASQQRILLNEANQLLHDWGAGRSASHRERAQRQLPVILLRLAGGERPSRHGQRSPSLESPSCVEPAHATAGCVQICGAQPVQDAMLDAFRVKFKWGAQSGRAES
jgi:hypothetical protein